MYSLDLDKLEILEKLEEEQTKIIRKEVAAALSKGQDELKVDIFGFGEEVHIKNPPNWKELEENWHKVFPQIAVEIEIESNIVRKGLGGSEEK